MCGGYEKLSMTLNSWVWWPSLLKRDEASLIFFFHPNLLPSSTFLLSPCLRYCGLFFFSLQHCVLSLTKKTNVLCLVRIQRVGLKLAMCTLTKCVRVSVVCFYAFVWQYTRMLLQCFIVLRKNKQLLSDFNYNGEYAKAPHSLVCICSVSGGSGFGVFSTWLLS